MSRFEVVPVSLESAGSRVTASGARIAEVRAQVQSTSAAAAATGDGEASSSFTGMLCTWDAELYYVGDFVSGLGRATTWAGNLYEVVDGSLFAGIDGNDGG